MIIPAMRGSDGAFFSRLLVRLSSIQKKTRGSGIVRRRVSERRTGVGIGRLYVPWHELLRSTGCRRPPATGTMAVGIASNLKQGVTLLRGDANVVGRDRLLSTGFIQASHVLARAWRHDGNGRIGMAIKDGKGAKKMGREPLVPGMVGVAKAEHMADFMLGRHPGQKAQNIVDRFLIRRAIAYVFSRILHVDIATENSLKASPVVGKPGFGGEFRPGDTAP